MSEPTGPTLCPWCSAPVSAEAVRCPSCGATLREEAEIEVPGVTRIDPAVARRPTGPDADHIGSLASDYQLLQPLIQQLVQQLAAEPVDPASLQPPSEEVRREMLRLEMEALRAELGAQQAEVGAQRAEAHGAPGDAPTQAPGDVPAASPEDETASS